MHQAGNHGSLAENGMFFNGIASVVHPDTTWATSHPSWPRQATISMLLMMLGTTLQRDT